MSSPLPSLKVHCCLRKKKASKIVDAEILLKSYWITGKWKGERPGGEAQHRRYHGAKQNLPNLITGKQSWRSLHAAPHGAEPSGESCSQWGPGPMSPGFSLDLLIVLQRERGCRGLNENEREVGSSYHCTCPGFLGGAVMKNLPAKAGDAGDDPWVRKIPWRRKWQPTPVFLPK